MRIWRVHGHDKIVAACASQPAKRNRQPTVYILLLPLLTTHLVALPKINAQIQARQLLRLWLLVTSVLILQRSNGNDVYVELCRRDLARQLDGLRDIVLSGLDRALYVCIVLAGFFAEVELALEETDDADLD